MEGLTPTDCRVYLPRFTLEYEESLNAVLQDMGMGIAFSDGANFSEMTPHPVRISKVKHKSFLQVNEEGTEAAAVTSVEIEVTVSPNPVLHFNRPFFCAIVDNETGAVLFMGAINKLA
jgi:serpin B